MRLRNKKTGEVKKMWKDNICLSFGDCNKVYYSLAELNEDWEDYAEPKEPLIKHEKIRKAVRAWADANRVIEARYSSCHDAECEFNARDDENKLIVFIGNFIEMNEKLDPSGRTIYTITELCGGEDD